MSNFILQSTLLLIRKNIENKAVCFALTGHDMCAHCLLYRIRVSRLDCVQYIQMLAYCTVITAIPGRSLNADTVVMVVYDCKQAVQEHVVGVARQLMMQLIVQLNVLSEIVGFWSELLKSLFHLMDPFI